METEYKIIEAQQKEQRGECMFEQVSTRYMSGYAYAFEVKDAVNAIMKRYKGGKEWKCVYNKANQTLTWRTTTMPFAEITVIRQMVEAILCQGHGLENMKVKAASTALEKLRTEIQKPLRPSRVYSRWVQIPLDKTLINEVVYSEE